MTRARFDTMVPGGSRIGALSFTPTGGEPHFDPGAPVATLVEAESAVVRLGALERQW